MPEPPLVEHRYTVNEIDRMRAAVRQMLSVTVWRSAYSGEARYHPPEEVEMHVRTYMLAGIRPEEVEKTAAERIAQSQLAHKRLLQAEGRI
jgi:hypothetical protein